LLGFYVLMNCCWIVRIV